MMNISENLQSVIDKVKQNLSDEDMDHLNELVMHGEYGVAYENLCVQLTEYDAVIPTSVHQELVSIGKFMKIDQSYWEDVQHE